MLEIIKSIIFGIVEGISEWLPISSTGHMILLNEILPLNVSAEFYDMFLVVIQLGAILAVVLTYFSRLWPFSAKEKYFIKKDTFVMWFKIVVACIPAVVVELAFGDKLEELFYNSTTVAIMLIVVGVLFIIVEGRNANRKTPAKINDISEITYKTALFIGLFQVIAAVLPGTSRSGATILGALLLGVSRGTAAEFTFFLSVPVMLGASAMKLLEFGLHFTGSEAAILIVGMVVAFAVSMVVIKFLMSFIRKHDFKPFGVYRIILGAAVLIFFALR